MDHQSATSDAASTSSRADERISARSVAEITGLSRKRIAEAASLGHLTIFKPPTGVRALVRYSRRSAEALARSMVNLATFQHPEPTEEPRDGA